MDRVIYLVEVRYTAMDGELTAWLAYGDRFFWSREEAEERAEEAKNDLINWEVRVVRFKRIDNQ